MELTDQVMFNGDELATNVWKSKYAQEEETHYDQMHKRLAKEFAKVELNYQLTEPLKNSDLKTHKDKLQKLSKYGQIRKNLDENTIYNLFKDFKYIVPQGSIMSQLGSKSIGSLSNCFVIGTPEDSYGGIFQKDEQMAQLMKRRGGVGLDISTLRPKDTLVSNAAKTTTGAVSFMHRFSNTTNEVAQNGRRGALMLSIDVNHPDVMDFIKIKRDKISVTGANISIKINNDFMKAVENDEDYLLQFPTTQIFEEIVDIESLEYGKLTTVDYGEVDCGEVEGYCYKGYVKRIKAREYWNEIIKSAHGYAEPGIIFVDNHHNYSPDGAYPQFKGVTTNPCFSYETKILTAHGYEKIGDLEGQDIDFVNKDGKIVSGTVFKSGEKATYTLNLSNKETIVTTIDHRFMLTDGSEKQAQFITKEDRLMPFFIINDKINEFVKYGFIQGDGCTGRLDSTAHLGIEVNIGEKDEDIAKLFNVKTTGKIYLGGFNEILKELGFDSSILPNRTLPTTFYNWSPDNKLMFLKGLWSANGSIIKGHRISFKSTCKELILELSNVLQEFGIDNYFTTNKAKEVEFSNGIYLCKESYDLNISKYRAVLKFAENIGFVHNYKQDSLKELILAKAPKILSAKITEVKPVYDFSLNDDTHWGVIQGVIAHNCGEIFMQPYDACRLIALNLYSFVKNPFTKDAEFDSDKFYRITYEAMRLSDDLIDLELKHIDRIIEKISKDATETSRTELELWLNIRSTAEASRRTGLGFTALGDCLAAIGYKYDSEEALLFIEQMMHIKMEAELDCTIDLAILRGSFNGWNLETEYDTSSTPFKGKNDFYEVLRQEYPDQVLRMIKHGRRNVSWSTVAPTGTVSLLTQTTSGIEPVFKAFYTRRKKITDESERVDFIDDLGIKWQEFSVLHPKFKDWLKIKMHDEESIIIDNLIQKSLQEWFEMSPWYGSEADNINWTKRVELQSIVQKYTTHSISSTINLPSDVSVEEVSNIYFEAWKQGLKGITVYRDGSRDGVLISSETNKSRDEFNYVDAVKRPKQLDAEVHMTKVGGVPHYVIVGLLNNKPYEIFIENKELPLGKGTLIKQSKGNYKFVKDGYERLVTGEMSDEQAAITRLTSTSLRHGTDIKFLVEQLNKCDGDLFSFTKGLARTLKKYIPDGVKSTVKCNDCGSSNVIFEEGCNKCLDCGSSACS